MGLDRFDYALNIGRATSYREYRNHFWPPDRRYDVSCLDLAPATPRLGADLAAGLAALATAIEAEWQQVKRAGAPSRTRFTDPRPIAGALRRIADTLPDGTDRLALTLRISAIENGYHDDILRGLADLEEDVAVVAGQLATWFGKQLGGLPTAFATRRDRRRQQLVVDVFTTFDAVGAHLARLHADLRLGDVPAFVATEVFFMAGEGNRHPKHIAYFLPEDEGVKRSPFKKTYYFGNTHRAILATQSAPLAARLLSIGVGFDPAGVRFAAIPTLGVFGHELGHCVRRPATDYKALNKADRWASVVLQEVMADVFGILIFAEVWAERLEVPRADIVAYYLAECLRYTNRGLGYFPDSDGMFLQLSYLVQFGALALESDGRLAGDPEAVIAGLRSLARVLADTALAGTPEAAVVLYRDFGPETSGPLEALVNGLSRFRISSVEYLQEHVRSGAVLAS